MIHTNLVCNQEEELLKTLVHEVTEKLREIRDGGDDKGKGMAKDLSNMLAANALTAALVLTVAAPCMLTRLEVSEVVFLDSWSGFAMTDQNRQTVNIVYVVLMFASFVLSAFALISSVLLSVFLGLVLVRPDQKLDFIDRVDVVKPRILAVSSMVLLLLAAPFGVAVVYGQTVALVCGALLLFFISSMYRFGRTLRQVSNELLATQLLIYRKLLLVMSPDSTSDKGGGRESEQHPTPRRGDSVCPAGGPLSF